MLWFIHWEFVAVVILLLLALVQPFAAGMEIHRSFMRHRCRPLLNWCCVYNNQAEWTPASVFAYFCPLSMAPLERSIPSCDLYSHTKRRFPCWPVFERMQCCIDFYGGCWRHNHHRGDKSRKYVLVTGAFTPCQLGCLLGVSSTSGRWNAELIH